MELQVKRILAAVTLYLVLAPSAFAGEKWLKSLDEAQKEAKSRNELIFVDMFAQWCGWCHRMEQEVFPSEAFQKVTDKMVLLRLNTEDGKEGTKYAQDFQVYNLPTFLILTPDLSLAGTIRGYNPAPQFAQLISSTLTQYADFKKRLSEEPTLKDPQKRLDLVKDLLSRRAFPKAEALLTKVIADKSAPRNVRDDAFFTLAVSQWNQKKMDASLKTLRTLLSSGPKGEPLERGSFMVGEVYLSQKNYQAALAEFKQFKKTFPNSLLAKNADYYVLQLERSTPTQN